MSAISRTVIAYIVLTGVPALSLAQTGPSDPQVITTSATAKVNVGSKKLSGHVLATVRVGIDGRVKDVLITENTTEAGFEPQLKRVLETARFRPAIDAAGRVVEVNTEMMVELRQGTGSEPKPLAAKPDPQLTDKEKARIKKMRCSDFVWEWEMLNDAASNTPTEFMPRIATTMYAAMRSDAGDYVDAKVWKAAPKGLRATADKCRESPNAAFWDGVFRSVMDEAVQK